MRHGMIGLFGVALLMLDTACAETNNPATDWFNRAGYGVFVHYLATLQNDSEKLHSLGRQTSWDACVREFDTEKFAGDMKDAGAGYVIFTCLQQTRFLIAPNATFGRLTGYAPGEACSSRDLIEDLYQSLHKRGIPLMLYWTGDGPSADAKSRAAMGWQAPVPVDWVRKWASVAEEYAVRYGDKVAGWWVDGCYTQHANLQYDDEKLGILARALKAGNPKRIIAFNNCVAVTAYSIHDDYTAGEQNAFTERPAQRWLKGSQWHVLSFLGTHPQSHMGMAAWGEPGTCLPWQDMADYLYEVNCGGGVVSIDVMLFRDGSIDRSQLELLKRMRPALAQRKAHPPQPPTAGNLAFRKTGRLLSLDGARELAWNGGVRKPSFALDGNMATFALAGGEWPWSYEADLAQNRTVSRVKVTFGSGYATQLRIQTSTDRNVWQTVVTTENTLTGKPYETTFNPVVTRYLRVGALKPNGPDQTGKQMAIAELEVFE